MGWTQDDCPWCARMLAWDYECFREEEGGTISLLVLCKFCNGEVEVTYEVVDVERGKDGPKEVAQHG